MIAEYLQTWTNVHWTCTRVLQLASTQLAVTSAVIIII